jgi:hypothetical protein
MNERQDILREKTVIDQRCKSYKALSWTGVVTGALVATGLGFLLNLFNIGIGLSVVNHTPEGITSVMVGGLIATLIGTMVTLFAAGWVSGFLARSYTWHKHLGVMQGFTAWCVALLIMLMLFSSNVGHFTLGSAVLADTFSPKATIAVTTNENAPAISAKNVNRPQLTVNPEKAANNIGKGALITFLLFFAGAVSACFGGFIGVCHEGDCCRTKDSCCKKSV